MIDSLTELVKSSREKRDRLNLDVKMNVINCENLSSDIQEQKIRKSELIQQLEKLELKRVSSESVVREI